MFQRNSLKQEKVNRIKAINSYLTKTDFVSVKISDNSNVFIGDNWYIIYCDGRIIDSCVLSFDDDAKKEFEIIKKMLNEYNDSELGDLDVTEVINDIQSYSEKVLRI